MVSFVRSSRLPRLSGPFLTPTSSPRLMASPLLPRRCERLESLNSSRVSRSSPVRYQACKPKPFIRHQATSCGRSSVEVLYSSKASTLSRSKTRLHMQLNEEMLNKELEEGNKLPDIDPVIREMSARLRQQVADLSLFLEEERLMHRETRLKAEEILKDKVEQMTKDHKEAMRLQAIGHQNVIDIMQQAHYTDITELKAENNKAVAKLKTEVEFITGAFHTYRAQTELEQKKQCEERIEKATQSLEIEYAGKTQEEKARLMKEFSLEAQREREKHRRDVDTVKRACEREVDMLNRRYRDHERDLSMLSQANNQIKEFQQKLDEADRRIDSLLEEVTKLTDTNAEYKARVNASEREFDERVARASLNLQARMDDLREDNSTLRMKYLKKCEELFDMLAENSTTNLEKQDIQQQLLQKILEIRKSIRRSTQSPF